MQNKVVHELCLCISDSFIKKQFHGSYASLYNQKEQDPSYSKVAIDPLVPTTLYKTVINMTMLITYK